MTVESIIPSSGTLKTVRSNAGTWTAARNGASLVVPEFVAPTNRGAAGVQLSASYFFYRNFFTLDLSDIPADYTIIGDVIMSLWVIAKSGAVGTNYYLQLGHQSTPVVVADFSAQTDEATIYASKSSNDITISQYNNWTLTASGKAALEAAFGSTIKLAIVNSRDYDDSDPGGSYTHVISWYDETESGKEPVFAFSASAAATPVSGLIRVASLRHIYRPGSYRLEANLGDVTSTVEMSQQQTLPTKLKDAQVEVAKGVQMSKSTAEELGKAYAAYAAMNQPKPNRIETPPPTPAKPTQPVLKPVELKALPGTNLWPVSDTVTGQRPIIKPRFTINESWWQKLTPWKESQGETFETAITTTISKVSAAISNFFKGWF